MKKFLTLMLICLCTNCVFAQSEISLTGDTTIAIQITVNEIVNENAEKKIVSADDSLSVQIEVLQQNLKKMKSKNVFRWIGSVLMMPASVLVGGVMILASAFARSKGAAIIGLATGVGGVVGGILLFASAVRNQNRIKGLSDSIKLMKQQAK